jgi:hypothetical protein
MPSLWRPAVPHPARPARRPRHRGSKTLVGTGLFVLLWSTGFVGAKYGLPTGPVHLPRRTASLVGIGVTALGVALVVVPPRKRRPDQAGSSPE